jgi:predicted enzyme related to lactoylglutathione lyase
MGKRESYEPGTFCAVDLATPDPAGAKEFYGSLFGWETEDVPGPDGTTYTLARLGGDVVAGLFEQREPGEPPRWVSYVSVEDADAAARKASELGGEVIQEPSDILDAGRTAVVRDPAGAALAVWQADTFAGAGRVNEPGCLTWNELATNDTAGALIFYNGLFAWTSEEWDTGGGPPYTVIRVGDRTNGGVRALSPPEEQSGAPPYWFPYFATESMESTTDRCGELGGATLFGPAEFPGGRLTGHRDAQGAVFALWEGELAD